MSEEQIQAVAEEGRAEKSSPDRRRIALRVCGDDGVSRIGELGRAARNAGFDGVEVELAGQAIGEQLDLLERAAADGAAVVAVAISLVNPAIDEACETLARVLRVSGRIGAKCVCVDLPPLQSTEQASRFSSHQTAINFVGTLLDRTRFEAERSGAAIALEAGCGVLRCPVEVREMIDTANSWAVGVCVDAGRVCESGGLPEWVSTLTHRVHCVRISTGSDSESIFDVGIGEALHCVRYRRTICVDSGGDFQAARGFIESAKIAGDGTV